MLCLGGQIAFILVLLGGGRNELDDPPIFTKIIKNRALARDILDVMKTSELRTFAGQSAFFEPLLIFCCLEAIFKNRALARDVLKISLMLYRFYLFHIDQNCVPARSVLKILMIS